MENRKTNAAGPSAAFFALVRHPFKLRLFLFLRLPAAFFSGLKVVSLDASHCRVSVPYRWFTKNPFRSTYFACLAMAGEMSTGLLAMACLYRRRPAMSMLVTGMQAQFHKKAKGRTSFVCTDGERIAEAIGQAVSTGTPQTVATLASGYNDAGELIAEFRLEWSFKVKG